MALRQQALEPFLSIVCLEQLLVGVEEDPDGLVAAGQPERQDRGLEPGPDVEGRRRGQVFLPHEVAHLGPIKHSLPWEHLKLENRTRYNLGFLSTSQTAKTYFQFFAPQMWLLGFLSPAISQRQSNYLSCCCLRPSAKDQGIT